VIRVEESDRGPVFAVRARPGASARRAGGEHHGALMVRTTCSPEKGKANDDIIRILAKALGLKKSALALVAGEKARDKKILAAGVDPADLQARLDALARAAR
jgi:uncharacterized protein YggU (UPF0235/DUF167 family)